MVPLLAKLAAWLRIDLGELSEAERRRPLLELSGILFGLPWMVIALVWSVSVFDLDLVVRSWPILGLMFILALLLNQFSYFQVARTDIGGYNYTSSTLSGIVFSSAFFMLGPVGVWLQLLVHLIYYGRSFPQGVHPRYRLNWARNLIFNIGVVPVIALLMVTLYRRLGGPIPLADLSLPSLAMALAAMLVFLPGQALFFELWVLLLRAMDLSLTETQENYWQMTRQTSIFLVFSEVPSLFGILAAALFSGMGVFAYLLFMVGVILVSFLARWLSQAVMDSSQHSQEITQLENFGREIIAAPPDTSTLPALLESYFPKMFGYHQAGIRLFDSRTLLQIPADLDPIPEQLWKWFEAHPENRSIPNNEVLPWSGELSLQQYYLVPILSVEKGEPLGGICLIHESWFVGVGTDLIPGLQVLAAQIASALHGNEVYRQTLAHEKVAQELAFAGQIQSSFLPEAAPRIPGWDLAATIKPAKETSGDFYDFIPLPAGRWGLLVADVADKGVGAALVMAQARTLIRTYALTFDSSPAQVLQAANERMLADSAEGLFVTAFYSVLDPERGELVYSNAGHNPPFLWETSESWPPKKLIRTGVPLGILENQVWAEKKVCIEARGGLFLYSDGLVEAMDAGDEMFGDDRLLSVMEKQRGAGADSFNTAVLEAVAGYADGVAQFDDQTLMVVTRL